MKRRLIIFTAVAVLVGTFVYICIPVYVTKTFFSLSLSDPEAPINEIFSTYYPVRDILARTPVALDAKGRIYLVGGKNKKVRILALNRHGEIESIIMPRFMDGRFLEWYCHLFSVSPSGNHIWTAVWDWTIKDYTVRITVHDRDGKGKADWLVESGNPVIFWLLNAYSEDTAYVLRMNGGITWFSFHHRSKATL